MRTWHEPLSLGNRRHGEPAHNWIKCIGVGSQRQHKVTFNVVQLGEIHSLWGKGRLQGCDIIWLIGGHSSYEIPPLLSLPPPQQWRIQDSRRVSVTEVATPTYYFD